MIMIDREALKRPTENPDEFLEIYRPVIIGALRKLHPTKASDPEYQQAALLGAYRAWDTHNNQAPFWRCVYAKIRYEINMLWRVSAPTPVKMTRQTVKACEKRVLEGSVNPSDVAIAKLGDAKEDWGRIEEATSQEPSPNEAIEHAEMITYLHRQVELLPEEYRDCVCEYFGLRDGELKTIREVSDKLGMKPRTVQHKLNRGLYILKRRMNGQETQGNGGG